MIIGRTIPPAAAPVTARDLLRGISGLFGDGYLRKIEKEVRGYFASEYVFLTSSGKAALSLILKGLSSIRTRKKVLIPAYTCYSVPSAIAHCGLEIALCDVDPDTLDFDYAQLKLLADESTLCIVPTHLFGIPSDIDRIRGICEKKGIFLVEDAAQAMGVEVAGRKLGTLGDVGFFSLGRGKNITCGSGGIILTSSGEIADSIRKFHSGLKREPALECAKGFAEAFFTKVFLHPILYWIPHGLPFLGLGETSFEIDFQVYPLSNYKAGMLNSWRERMEEYNHRRTLNGRQYKKALSVRAERKIYSRDIPYLRFPVYATGPEEKAQACRKYGNLGISPMYPDTVNRIERLARGFAGREYPGAEWIARTLMTLPTHVLLTDKDMKWICDSLFSTYFEPIPTGLKR